eukprot:SAG31_NODE_26230_length_446_cov_0.697406_1_plen_56_part_01
MLCLDSVLGARERAPRLLGQQRLGGRLRASSQYNATVTMRLVVAAAALMIVVVAHP